MRAVKWLTIVAVVVAAFLGARYGFLRAIQASLSYCVEARFAFLPPDDKPLEEWLKVQPGVVPHTVVVQRHGPGGHLQEVGFIQVRNLAGEPAFPRLNDKCVDLGYEGSDTSFRDCEDRHRH